jgi:hypothetical protein
MKTTGQSATHVLTNRDVSPLMRSLEPVKKERIALTIWRLNQGYVSQKRRGVLL